MDITVKMARFQIKQSVLIGNTTLVRTYAKKSVKIGPKIIFNKKLFNLVQTLTFFG